MAASVGGLILPRRTALADVRALLRHLPTGHEQRPAWRHVVAELSKAAAGADAADVTIALRMALSMEGVECRPK